MAIRDSYHIQEEKIHHVLSNARRRRTLQLLKKERGGAELRTLAELIAEAESGESPPPRNIQKSVYSSLHQTHLPKLDEHGIVDYDRDRKTITLTPRARRVDLYMEVLTPYGITWSTYYRTLSVLSLMTIIADQLGALGIGGNHTVLLASAFLVLIAISTVYQLWSDNWIQIRGLIGD